MTQLLKHRDDDLTFEQETVLNLVILYHLSFACFPSCFQVEHGTCALGLSALSYVSVRDQYARSNVIRWCRAGGRKTPTTLDQSGSLRRESISWCFDSRPSLCEDYFRKKTPPGFLQFGAVCEMLTAWAAFCGWWVYVTQSWLRNSKRETIWLLESSSSTLYNGRSIKCAQRTKNDQNDCEAV